VFAGGSGKTALWGRVGMVGSEAAAGWSAVWVGLELDCMCYRLVNV
jgi:hypothetical protein